MAKLSKLITDSLKQIASETTEVGPDNETLVTKSEKLARLLWKKALGQETEVVAGKIKTFRPDMSAMQIILDRIDGKVLNTDEIKQRDESIPDRISKIGRDKINDIKNA
jgi:hypothetical protein